jgi:hypothetical protein
MRRFIEITDRGGTPMNDRMNRAARNTVGGNRNRSRDANIASRSG